MRIKNIVNLNKASQDPTELRELLKLLPKRPREVVLEIGVDHGYSLLNWRRRFHPKLLIGVDNNTGCVPNEVRDAARATILYANSQSLKTYDMIINRLGRRSVDFLFIDGDHAYESVKADFNIYSNLVAEGGEIVLHDAALLGHPLVEVNKFWNEIKDKYDAELISKGGTGYGVIFNWQLQN